MTDRPDPGKPRPGDDAPVRRPYSPPTIVWEEPFEVEANLASACAKSPFDGGAACSATPSS